MIFKKILIFLLIGVGFVGFVGCFEEVEEPGVVETPVREPQNEGHPPQVEEPGVVEAPAEDLQNIPVVQLVPFGLAERNGTLYMVGSDNNCLYKVSGVDGVARRVGNVEDFGADEGSPSGLAERNGTLYMVGSDNNCLYRVNTVTGVATRVGNVEDFGVDE